ncbi:exopolysaccharide biosynthesis polyprenyl glycosylphosphotransferase [Sulfurovum indicum]|uniref:Exopolysaccharide biosynthesis polyprenyl glycosylphosphotransferase n=2 Tax=Sulfurovaceae TaxID=2771472 RepID=A0A7M1S679_9BACT|nr:exopolysaccharide biosynthesis polyprenyl glycosylphosphotransferase [Sulfurovum indicum]
MREIGLEWIYRLLQEPKRMWRRYLVGNPLFLVRTYLWHKKQKRERMRRYYETVAGEKRLTFIPDLSLVTHRVYPYFKRAVDIIVASIAILLLSPVMLTVAMLIKAESRGPVLFSQKRVGRDGKVFSMYKFRSMVQNAEALKKELAAANESKDGVIFKMKDDPRITKVGKFIRKWSIDELPQLFNVLKGDMSLVGPRPPVPSEVAEYSSEDLKRLHIVPGITCYWQVSGRSEIPFKQQVDLDKKYISTRSLWTDIKILFATIPAVLAQKGAY